MNDNIFTEEKVVAATGEILINESEFDTAIEKVMRDQMNDPALEGMGKLLIPMTGTIFAKEMKKILFPKEPENKEV